MSATVPGEKQRLEILEAVNQTVRDHFYDPDLRGVDWQAAVVRHRAAILEAQNAVNALLKELGTSHTGFYHSSLRRPSSNATISATYASFEHNGSKRWVFQDVHEGGAAYLAGIRPGHTLVSVDGVPYAPPEHPVFPGGRPLVLAVLGNEDRQQRLTVEISKIVEKHHRLRLRYFGVEAPSVEPASPENAGRY